MSKGFTLIELLIVIGILAILATATVLVLNPVELFRQARDAQRLADLDTLRSAITLYLTDVAPPTSLEDATAPAFTCAGNFGQSASVAVASKRFMGVFAAESGIRIAAATNRVVNGDGWLPVNFSLITGGSPFGALPVDPTNDGTNNYQYACNNGTKAFELNAVLESAKYIPMMTADGGDNAGSAAGVVGVAGASVAYETGTNLAL